MVTMDDEEFRLWMLDDVIAENVAQRKALFKMLDRMGNGGTAPA